MMNASVAGWYALLGIGSCGYSLLHITHCLDIIPVATSYIWNFRDEYAVTRFSTRHCSYYTPRITVYEIWNGYLSRIYEDEIVKGGLDIVYAGT